MSFLYNNNIFSVNFSGLTTLLLPPLLRQPAEIAWNTSLAYPMQNDNLLFTEYLTGSTYPLYSNSSIYVPGKRVIYSDDAIYENINGSIGFPPTNTNFWIQLNPTFIGAEERSCYNSQKITLEYALNRQYQILPFISNQLTWTGANHTDQIYINNNNVTTNRFIMGNSGIYSSTMSKTGAIEYIDGGQWMGRSFTASSKYDFTVWVPNLTLYPNITNSSVSAYTQDYILAGMMYSVSGY
jgi:hypothetical protein